MTMTRGFQWLISALWAVLCPTADAFQVENRVDTDAGRPVTVAGEGAASTAIRSQSVLTSDVPQEPFYSGPVPRTEHIADDATLNDVCGIGSDCWAVGERGVIVRSQDSGSHWETSMIPAECSLASVCFLTNQIGFVAGSRFDAFQRQHVGVLLATRDGGSSWSVVGATQQNSNVQTGVEVGVIEAGALPPLSFVKFFDLKNAVAIGIPDSISSDSMVLRTADGGLTWRRLDTKQSAARWLSGDFFSPNDGIIVGLGDAYGSVVGNQVITLQQPQRTLRRRRDASLTRDGTGWMVGDGGLLLTTADGGVTWRPPAGLLSPALNDVFDFHSVEHRGSNVCIAGSPGSVVLHSNDSGRSWTFRQLGSSAPITRIRFVGDSSVVAVGAFGIIHRSDDGGLTWAAVRNGNYRAAVMSLPTDVDDTPFPMLADIGGDQGYRTVVVQLSARLPRSGVDDALAANRLRIAVAMSGSTSFVQDWMFSRTQPMQNEVQKELLKTWGLQTDGRLTELLPQRLAQWIRIWRPDAISVDFGSATDQVSGIWLQALEPAFAIAAGTNARGAILDQVGLAPWSVSRTVVRLPVTDTSALSFSRDTVLKNLATTNELIVQHCELAAGLRDNTAAESDSAPNVFMAYQARLNGQAAATPTHLLAGMMNAPGTDSRRSLRTLEAGNLDHLLQTAKQDQTTRAALKGHLNITGTPLSLIADLQTLGRDLPPKLALRQLQHLAALYESLENLEGQIAVLKEMTTRFPDAPESADAAELLFQFYSSDELRFLRRQGGAAGLVADRESLVKQAMNRIPGVPAGAGANLQPQNDLIPANGIMMQPEKRPMQGLKLPNANGRDTAAIDAVWDRNADAALKLLHRLAPARAASPRTLLRHAANVRRRGTLGDQNTVLSRAAAGEGLYAMLARTESQAAYGAVQTPVPVINLPQVQSKPLLDGNMTEECWQNAIELHLAGETASNNATSDCLVMLAWDADHVYVAGRVEFAEGHSSQLDKTTPRHHDADHQQRDRIKISFDTDRDFTTSYDFTIDEAGLTSERCWRAKSWNPVWYVAEEADELVWRFEIAIPQSELQAAQVKPGDLWAIRVQRVLPGVLEQSLVNSDADAQAEDTGGFGLLRFIRDRKTR